MAIHILNGAVASGASTFCAVTDAENHTVQTVFTGTITAITVDLEGSLDNANWFQLGTATFSAGELAASSALLHVANKPASYVRVRPHTITASTDITIDCWYDAEFSQ